MQKELYRCKLCKDKMRGNFKQHIYSHLKPVLTSMDSCPVCGKQVSSLKGLKIHAKQMKDEKHIALSYVISMRHSRMKNRGKAFECFMNVYFEKCE